ncbi:MAG: hypothetical protein EOO00_10280, partial [Chitinophagaceae bacterium]
MAHMSQLMYPTEIYCPNSPAMKRGAFTLSLDCEGLWGMADQPKLINSGLISDIALAKAYELIYKVLDANNVKATCAFVSAFAAGEGALGEESHLLRELARREPTWFSHFDRAMQCKNMDGWFGNLYYRKLRSAGHEMGWHGATHLSLADSTASESIDLELQLAKNLNATLSESPQTLIFPRNLVGHLDELQK